MTAEYSRISKSWLVFCPPTARRREGKWLDMLSKWDSYMMRNYKKVRERCRKVSSPSYSGQTIHNSTYSCVSHIWPRSCWLGLTTQTYFTYLNYEGKKISEVSLIVADFTISVCGSSCKTVFTFSASFWLLCVLFLFTSISIPRMECQEIARERKAERMRPKKTELHELPYTKMLKTGIIRLTSDSIR